jgi:excinuclease ABC subunit C
LSILTRETVKSPRSEWDSPGFLSKIPGAPGVYLFRDGAGGVLYVGKAKDLRQRLSSYVRSGGDTSPKTVLMLKRAWTLELIVTATEKEALILEATLIKEHRPRYNVVLRDDKAYPFLRLEKKGPFPRLSVVRRRKKDGALYFGPYPSGGAVKETMRFISSVFGLRTCKGRSLRVGDRACLKHQIGRCSAPCIGAVSSEEYLDLVRQVRLFLEGRTRSLQDALKRQMREASSALEFERAALLRDRLSAFEEVTERQSVVADLHTDWDILGLARRGPRAAVALVRVRDGIVRGQEVHNVQGLQEETDQAVLSLFIRDYYQDCPVPIPGEILLPGEVEDRDLISEWLSETAGRKVVLSRPSRGVRRRLLGMALENAGQAMLGLEEAEREWDGRAEEIRTVLGLRRFPHAVEGIDISTTGGEFAVGSLVSFRNGRPSKRGYRHYNIKGVHRPDDYAMIREVVTRRIAGGIEKGDLPDLFLVDGGIGQLRQGVDAAAAAGIEGQVEWVSLAKESRQEGEKIYRPGWADPLFLPRHHPVLLFLQRVRDEAHRFGLNLHRKRRGKARLGSRLGDIPGVGSKRQRALLSHFRGITGVRSASEEELCQVPVISAGLAHSIYEYLRSGSKGAD